MAKIEVRGMRPMRKALKDVENGLQDLKSAHQKIGEEAARDIKGALPSKSGAWKAAIEDSSTKTMAKVIWGREGSAGRRGGIVYAGWVEFGGVVNWRSRTPPRPHGPFAWGYRTVAFMVIRRQRIAQGRYVYPTAERHEDKYRDLYGEYVGGLLRKAGLQ